MLRIGVTGGIGSGKSLVSAILRSNGIPVFDCDSRAKAIMASDISVRKELQSVSGIDFFPNGELDRGALAGYLFRMPENASVVNGVVHPRVIAEYNRWCKTLDSNGIDMCAVESAVLYESELNSFVDFIVLVDAPEEVRVDRAAKRDMADREKIRERVRMQADMRILAAKADWVIDNSGNESRLSFHVGKMLRYIYDNKLI